MKAVSNYEAPQAELLLIRVEQNLLQSQTGTGRGESIVFDNESDFDEFFN